MNGGVVAGGNQQQFGIPIDDEYSIFGAFVAAELRSISSDRAAYVKRKLNRALMDLMEEVELMVSSSWKKTIFYN